MCPPKNPGAPVTSACFIFSACTTKAGKRPSWYTQAVFARRLLVTASLLNAACGTAKDGPVAMPPAATPQTFIEAGEAPANTAPADADPDAEATERSTDDPGDARPSAPERVTTDINERYDEQTNPGEWEGRFEREGREVHDHRAEIIAALALRPGMEIADVGAGTGLFTLELAEAVGTHGRVFAVDVQAYFLDHIRQKADKAKLDNVDVVRATQDHVGLDPRSVDLILMVDAYHHVEQPAAYLASIHSALRDGGRLVIVDYDRTKAITQWKRDHIRATPAEFTAEIESSGFARVRTHDGILRENFFFEFERR